MSLDTTMWLTVWRVLTFHNKFNNGLSQGIYNSCLCILWQLILWGGGGILARPNLFFIVTEHPHPLRPKKQQKQKTTYFAFYSIECKPDENAVTTKILKICFTTIWNSNCFLNTLMQYHLAMALSNTTSCLFYLSTETTRLHRLTYLSPN